MSYNYETVTFPSSDGIHTIHADIFTPKSRTAKGVVQLAHGMVDHPGRYLNLISFLTDSGYILAGHHHLGHGRSVLCEDEFGFFADKNGIQYILDDMNTMNRYLRDAYPALPLIVFGHSMGSFIARLYVLQHPHSMRGVVIHGTGGPNRLAPLGKLVGRMVSFFSGKRSRSMLITALAFGSYNRGFDKSEGRNAWLSRDKDEPAVKDKKNDPLASFMFTTSGYIDLFDMLIRSNSREWFEGYPKDMRTLIVSGDMDPVGGYGRGVKYVYKQLMMQGCSDVMLQLYEGARHELFNETNKEEFFADLLEWLNGVAL